MQTGHEGFVLATVFDRTGARLYSGSVEGAINVWDVASGERADTWPWHTGPVRDLAYLPKGDVLLSASKDGTVAIGKADTGELTKRLAGDGAGVFCVAASGRLVATGSFDGRIRIWDMDTGDLIAHLSGHGEAVTSVDFLSHTHLVSASRDSTLKVWDLENNACMRTLTGCTQFVTKVRAFPDEKRAISTSEDGKVILWDCDSGTAIWTRKVGDKTPIWGLALAPCGAFAITGAAGVTSRWTTTTGEEGRPMPTSAFAHRGISIAPDERLAALGGDEGNIAIYDLVEDTTLRICMGNDFGLLSAAASGDRVAIGHRNGAITTVAANGRKTTRSGAHALMVYDLCVLNADRYASIGFDGRLCIWRWGENEPERTMLHGGPMFAVSATADAARVLSVGANAFRVWDTHTGEAVVEVTDIGSGGHTVGDMSADGTLILTGGEDRYIRCWSGAGQLQSTFARDQNMTCVIRLVPGTRQALFGDAFGRVSLLHLDTGEMEVLHEVHEDWIRRLHISRDGRCVLSVSQESVGVLYDLVERRVIAEPTFDRSIPVATIDPAGAVVAITNEGAIIHQASAVS